MENLILSSWAVKYLAEVTQETLLVCYVADLFLSGDGGLSLIQHGEQLWDFQLETLIWGRLGAAADLGLDRRYLRLEGGWREMRDI